MRLVFQIFATVFLASLFLGGLLMLAIDLDKGSAISELQSSPFTSWIIPNSSPGLFYLGGLLWLLSGLGAVVGIVAVYLKKERFGMIVGIALGVMTLISALVQPSLEGIGANDPRYTGYAIGFFGLIGVGMLIFLHNGLKSERNA